MDMHKHVDRSVLTLLQSLLTVTLDPPPKPMLRTSGIWKLVRTPPIWKRTVYY